MKFGCIKIGSFKIYILNVDYVCSRVMRGRFSCIKEGYVGSIYRWSLYLCIMVIYIIVNYLVFMCVFYEWLFCFKGLRLYVYLVCVW